MIRTYSKESSFLALLDSLQFKRGFPNRSRKYKVAEGLQTETYPYSGFWVRVYSPPKP